ncbi:hypothetical protein GCM10010274_51920 [Streptomyces lavendofoliae]|uniref:Uncharacterized protein n=1 Tax=Streptomyces lavendofoliae TaxID=67314 RepID=A0A918I1W5_9ACTN|nr:hypothetical protein GCM10010274_51920 [Streptomyces lavendofoliae]
MEPYWAEKAAHQLAADGVRVEITPRLREAMAEEWTWARYPMPWCTRSEIREVSEAAQKIYDDIRHGQLLIHAHAEDGHTTVAVGTYLGSGKSAYLHGENQSAAGRRHLRLARPGPGRLREGPRRRHAARPGTADRHRTRRRPSPNVPTHRRT